LQVVVAEEIKDVLEPLEEQVVVEQDLDLILELAVVMVRLTLVVEVVETEMLTQDLAVMVDLVLLL
jgi:hypothetical protein